MARPAPPAGGSSGILGGRFSGATDDRAVRTRRARRTLTVPADEPRVLLDANVVLDVLLDRRPHAGPASQVLSAASTPGGSRAR